MEMDSKALVGHAEVNPGKMSGEPVFAGTRVTIRTLIDNLKAEATLQDVALDFGLDRDVLHGVLDEMFAVYRAHVLSAAHEGVH